MIKVCAQCISRHKEDHSHILIRKHQNSNAESKNVKISDVPPVAFSNYYYYDSEDSTGPEENIAYDPVSVQTRQKAIAPPKSKPSKNSCNCALL